MDWKFSSNAPIYTQLVEQIKLRIISGAYIPGQRIPAVRELAQEAGVNPNTMQRAMQELERLGLLFSIRTSGRFVTEDIDMIERTKEAMAQKLMEEFLKQMEALGCEKEEIIRLMTDYLKGGQPHGDSGV